MASIKRAAYLSLLSYFRTIFLVVAIVSAFVITVVFLLQFSGGATIGTVTIAIERLIQWRNILSGFGAYAGWGITLTLVIMLAIYARRSGKVKREKIFQKIFDQKFEELKEKYQIGELEALESTVEMKEIEKEYDKHLAALHSLEGEASINEYQKAAFRQELLKRISILEQYHFAMDIQRRVEAKINPDEVALPEPKTKWEKIQTFFISQGLLSTLNRGTRLLYFASLILLVPALLGIYSPSSASTLNNRIIQLKDLRIELSQQEFEQEKSRLGNPENELNNEDKQVLEEVAREYEYKVSPQLITATTRAPMFAIRANLVRQAVLTEATKRANVAKQGYAAGATWEQYPSGSNTENLSALEKQIVEMPERATFSRGPVTQQGQQMYADLEDLAKRSPTFMEKIRIQWHSFQKPVSSLDISYALFNNMTGTIAGETPGPFGDILKGFDLKNMQAAARSYNETQAKQFLTVLSKKEGLDKAFGVMNSSDLSTGVIGNYERADFQNTMRTVIDKMPMQEINQRFAEHPPSIKIAPEKHVNMEKAVAAVKDYNISVSSSQMYRNNLSNADSLIDFTDLFPGQFQSETRTEYGKLLTELRRNIDPPSDYPSSRPSGGSGGGGGGGGGFTPKETTVSRSSFSRSRSFISLRGFSRIGGVLIGQTPSDISQESPSKLNFVDLRWEVKDNNIRFVLVDDKGKEFRSSQFREPIAYHALNYAADGRMTAATMISAEPLIELKILLHPTLIDSAFGYRIIELDRLVDEFSEEGTKLYEPRREAEKRIKLQQFLYKFAANIRLLVMLEDMYDSKTVQFKNKIKDSVNKKEVTDQVTALLQDKASISDPNKSPLTVKKEFFDPEIVNIIIGEASGTTAESLSRAIRDKAGKQWQEVKSSKDEQKIDELQRRWASPPPEFQIWSGVREHPFGSNVNEFFVADGSETPMPFDFMLQVAFTSPPVFMDESTAETYNDTQPWEFPLLREMIQTNVLESISTRDRARAILKDTSEFAMLQRLFRMALDGNMGENFPVERLVELSSLLANSAPKTVYRTPRWNARPQEEMIKQIEEAIKKASNDDEKQQLQEYLELTKSEYSKISPIREALGVSKDEPPKGAKELPLPPLE